MTSSTAGQEMKNVTCSKRHFLAQFVIIMKEVSRNDLCLITFHSNQYSSPMLSVLYLSNRGSSGCFKFQGKQQESGRDVDEK